MARQGEKHHSENARVARPTVEVSKRAVGRERAGVTAAHHIRPDSSHLFGYFVRFPYIVLVGNGNKTARGPSHRREKIAVNTVPPLVSEKTDN